MCLRILFLMGSLTVTAAAETSSKSCSLDGNCPTSLPDMSGDLDLDVAAFLQHKSEVKRHKVAALTEQLYKKSTFFAAGWRPSKSKGKSKGKGKAHQGCSDTKGWTSDLGYTCKDYGKWFCADGKKKAGTNGAYLGEANNWPEKNCCVCGKPADSGDNGGGKIKAAKKQKSMKVAGGSECAAFLIIETGYGSLCDYVKSGAYSVKELVGIVGEQTCTAHEVEKICLGEEPEPEDPSDPSSCAARLEEAKPEKGELCAPVCLGGWLKDMTSTIKSHTGCADEELTDICECGERVRGSDKKGNDNSNDEEDEGGTTVAPTTVATTTVAPTKAACRDQVLTGAWGARGTYTCDTYKVHKSYCGHAEIKNKCCFCKE